MCHPVPYDKRSNVGPPEEPLKALANPVSVRGSRQAELGDVFFDISGIQNATDSVINARRRRAPSKCDHSPEVLRAKGSVRDLPCHREVITCGQLGEFAHDVNAIYLSLAYQPLCWQGELPRAQEFPKLLL